jgi:hypothetical protein
MCESPSVSPTLGNVSATVCHYLTLVSLRGSGCLLLFLSWVVSVFFGGGGAQLVRALYHLTYAPGPRIVYLMFLMKYIDFIMRITSDLSFL